MGFLVQRFFQRCTQQSYQFILELIPIALAIAYGRTFFRKKKAIQFTYDHIVFVHILNSKTAKDECFLNLVRAIVQ